MRVAERGRNRTPEEGGRKVWQQVQDEMVVHKVVGVGLGEGGQGDMQEDANTQLEWALDMCGQLVVARRGKGAGPSRVV